MKLVLVEWLDSNAVNGWHPKQQFQNDGISKCQSVGILMKETPKEIALVLNLSGELWSDAIYIPKSCITRMRQLKVKEK